MRYALTQSAAISRRARQNRETMADGIEIERKFLVEQLPDDLDAYPHREIEQGYLAITDDVEVRVRRYGDEAFLTIKSSGDESRVEEEIEIDRAGSPRCGRSPTAGGSRSAATGSRPATA